MYLICIYINYLTKNCVEDIFTQTSMWIVLSDFFLMRRFAVLRF